MGGGKKSKSKSKSKSKPKTKAQKQFSANKAKGLGTGSAAKANKAANKAKAKSNYSASQAAKGKTTTSSASKKTSGVGPVSSGKAYAKAVNSAKNQPTKKTSGVGPVASGTSYAAAVNSAKNAPTKKTSGVGPVASGAKYAASLASAPKAKSSPSYNDGQLVAMDNLGSKLAIGAMTGIVGGALGIKNKVQEAAENLRRINEQKMEGLGDQSSIYSSPGTLGASLSGIDAPKSARFESATGSDAFANSLGINTDVGGVNYGGLGSVREGGDFNPNANTSRAIFSGSNPNTSDLSRESFNFGPTVDRFGRGDDYARNINEFGMRFGDTSEARADAYNNTLTGRKNLFDNATSGSGPVASGDAYARGLEVSRFGSPMNAGKTILNTIPGVNFRLQNDKELADSVGRAPTLTGGGGGGGARFAAAALTPEEILLPEEVSPAAAGPTYQQTGLDNNRLMQIQQEAYRQAYNPMTVGGFNPMFRFFGSRQGPRRGAFRRAFTRTG